MNARRAAPLIVAASIRLLAIAVSDREVADVARYRKVADHLLDVSWNPYQAPRLYPYPPVWVWVEAGAGWLSRQAEVSFPLLMKLPTLAAELWIVALLARRTRAGAWIYALHPVAIMIGAFHGQFDAIALALVVAAVDALQWERRDRSALLLAAAIALKSFPVLLLPLFVLELKTRRHRLRFAALALGPVAALLVPYALHDFGALRRELFGYGGVADFGWIGAWRGLAWLGGAGLARSEAVYWPSAIAAGKLLFLGSYAVLLLWLLSRRATVRRASLMTFLLFLTFYGAISAQYLLWVVPLAALWPERWMIAHGVACTVALAGFYFFLAPGVLAPEALALARPVGGWLWAIGTAAALAIGVGWLISLIAGERRPESEAVARAV